MAYLHRYLEYRDVGFKRLAALRFAWLVTFAGLRPIAIRSHIRR